jgi:hypothetical protein
MKTKIETSARHESHQINPLEIKKKLLDCGYVAPFVLSELVRSFQESTEY